MDFHKQENTSSTTPSPKRMMMMMMKNKTPSSSSPSPSPSSSSSSLTQKTRDIINFEHDDQVVSDDDQREGMAIMATTEEKKQKRVSSAGRRVAAAAGGAEKAGMICCQAEKCTADLSVAKRYHRRHKVCELHAKAPSVLVAGLCQRFCQQCSRFHELSEFDETKRSCRRRLAGHNERRRKSTSDLQGEGGSSSQAKVSNPQLKASDHEKAPNNIGTSAYKQYQIR